MIEGTTVESYKVVGKKKPALKSDYCKPCFSRTNNLCEISRATTKCWEIRNRVQ